MTPARWASVKQVTLAALERTESERSPWLAEACAGDDALRRDVESLLAAHAKAGDFLERPGVAVTGGAEAIAAAALQGSPSLDTGRAVGPYRIIRELGQGGMGVVRLAERADATFEKQVAIKVVRGGLAGDLAMQRFRDERRILATLDHPNIARLLDGGATDDGLPYLVMEYVDGVPVDLYCQAMPVRRRLELFRQVCAAVQYAHQHLVIHRDLKARNILVTSDGTPKLLDFGIAKLLDPGTAPEDQTRTGARALTLDGASPEQVRGEPMTVTSDVYSLGVLLYRLLTGQSPYGPGRRTDAELMHAICEEAPVRPSDVAAPSARELRGDLDVIVLKALRKEPERRYASVEPLAEDLRRYLAGHPVSARPDSLRYRAGKFIARHRVAVVAAAVVVVALAAAFVETSRQRARAERRLTDVRKLAGSFLFEFHDAIKDLSGATAARELVVKKAADYLTQLSAEESSDPTLLLETADAWRRLAAVQGLPTRFSLGHTADAERSLERALALLDRLSPSDRKTAAAGLARMRTLNDQGSLFAAQGRSADAAQRHREAGRTLESIATAVDEPTLRTERTYTSVNLADALLEGGDMPSALEEFERTLARIDGWLQQAPNDASILRSMGVVSERIGDVLALQKRWPEARVDRKSTRLNSSH